MAGISYDDVWEAVKTLTPEEQRRLRKLLGALLARRGKPLSKLDELDFRLLKKGVIRDIPRPITDLTPYQNRRLVKIEGQPLSETIIEERR